MLPESRTLRFLRTAQLRALETYWYLRLVEGTPHIFSLYQRYYQKTTDLLTALGMNREEITAFALDEGTEALWERVRKGGDWSRSCPLTIR